jgi:transcription elongation factor SPT5
MDMDDDFALQGQESDPIQPENEEVELNQPERRSGRARGSIYDAPGDDEEKEDEDEEEEDTHRGRKRAKVRFCL